MAILNIKNIQKRISIPTKHGDAAREEIGRRIIEEIISRTKRGLDVDGRAFVGYSKSYKESDDYKAIGKSGRPNLSASGDMLESIEVLGHGTGFILIGYDAGDPEAGKAEGNSIGSFGDKSGHAAKARPFIGISDESLQLILAEFDSEAPETTEARSILQGQVQSLFSRFLVPNDG